MSEFVCGAIDEFDNVVEISRNKNWICDFSNNSLLGSMALDLQIASNCLSFDFLQDVFD